MFAIPRSSNGPKPFYASPGVTTINISKNGISSKRMKNDFSQKFFWFDNIVPNQQNKWLGFSVEKKKLQLCTDTKVENFASCPKVACFCWGFQPQKGSQSRSNFRKCIISRVVSFLLLELLVVWRYDMTVWTCCKQAKDWPNYWQPIIKTTQSSACSREWCSKLQLGLKNKPKIQENPHK